ncbi:activating transcription factor 7-interacting protein 1 isoform X1 [Denticeps clupeoides]|uniref:Fibronectin type-III domain-containing protein n=1 Tax=Denticeps clupeoides TaxID=299321 RepID=A0AAY4ADC8_9TELE|nr:activating transcription factor 7-interacting protein 1-like isoform X1 [Denticeps clupeoides]XP_028827915.1 activating transcription factor 7-interacting protein 1-like isoform X1 [Denticeps clupeoides]XP_028827916.1 activating transcription factor 7-interacting protein 1-like isoform X1 [Denticeps clupeoides]
MEVAVPEEPQKKIFRARKTMKMSDRQQLEVLHNTLATTSAPSNSSSPSQTPLVNGMHSEDGNKNSEKSKKRESRARSPDLPSVCLQSYPLTQSQTSSSAANSANPSQSLKVTTKESEKGEKSKDGLSKKLEREEDEAKKSDKSEEKETEESRAKPKKTRSTSPTSACQKNGAEKDSKEDTVAMDTEATPSVPVEKTCRSSSSRSSSPSAGIESDQEVKEGFLFLSEEEENMGEKDDGKEMNEDKMDVDGSKGKKKREDNQTSQSSTPAASTGRNTPTAKKRGLSQDADKNEQKDGDETTRGVKVGKRARVDGVELEAQLAVKIMANSDTRLKLEKVVQKLVEERLRVWELTVFDRNLQELKERVEKMDCATKHQNSLNTLQAKIARLDKKFVAANQAKENSKRPQDAQTNSTVKTTPPVNTTLVQRNVRTTVDTKTNQGQAVAADNSTASPAQPKPLSTPTTPTSSALAAPAPILQIISTNSTNTGAPAVSTAQPGQAQTLLLKTTAPTQNPSTSGGQTVLPPLLIQLPLTMTSGQGGTTLVTAHNTGTGMGLIPVSSLATVNSLNKAKTTSATTTTFILQSKPTVTTQTPSSSSTMLLTPSSSSPAGQVSVAPPQVSLPRAVYQGGSGMVSAPSAGVSVTTARTPTQCASVVGVASATSSPATTVPAATGSTAAGPPSVSAMTSKTDNQASSTAAPKAPGQPTRARGSVIDLTEDDDDVQVTGVKKAPASAGSSPIQRSTGHPPSLISSAPTGSTARASPQNGQRPQMAAYHRPPQDSPSKSRLGSSSGTPPSFPASLPPLPSAPTPPGRLPPEAMHTSPPQQPQLKLARVQSQNGIVLSWCVAETDRNCAAVESYYLYAYHQEHQGAAATGPQSQWKKIGEVKALPLPMACTLTQFVSGSTYYFAVRAKDVYGRFGPFCEPQCTDVISPVSSSSS